MNHRLPPYKPSWATAMHCFMVSCRHRSAEASPELAPSLIVSPQDVNSLGAAHSAKIACSSRNHPQVRYKTLPEQ
jgi:hypothetical protein